ncbi:MAG: HupE/UreJ family protein [Pseudomonadota bacterium]
MKKTVLIAAGLFLLPTAALAHPSLTHHVHGFMAGVSHPLTGLDHLLAMLSVGLWASQKGGRALWIWPAAFVIALIAGGAMGMAGIALPLVEPAIIASLLVLGVAIAATLMLPTAAGVAVIALFGLFHGNAHGLEAPVGGAGPYALGFVLSTVTLHVMGLALGLSAQRMQRPVMVRAGAVLIAATSLVMAFA